MARLPTPKGDANAWGTILNDFLAVELNNDGTLKRAGEIAGKVNKSGDTMTGPLTLSGDPSSNLQAATKQYVDSISSSGAPDATTSSKGIVQLAGDLSGTASAPILINNAVTTAKIADGQVTAAKVAADVATQAELDAIAQHTVPSGGTSGQVLAKNSNTDYDIHWISSAGGGGQPSATFVIAAADSAQGSKDAADFVCTGTDDHLVFQQALDALNAVPGFNSGYGCIRLMEGDYYMGDTFDFGAVDGCVQWIGSGIDITWIYFPDTKYATFSVGPFRFADVSIVSLDPSNSGGYLLELATGDALVERVSIYGRAGGSGIIASGGGFNENVTIRDCLVHRFSGDPLSAYQGITSSFSGTIVEGCRVTGYSIGIDIGPNADGSQVIGNTVSHDQNITGGSLGYAIGIDCNAVTVIGNKIDGDFDTGIQIESGRTAVVSGNTFDVSAPSGHGMYIHGNDCLVEGNRVIAHNGSVTAFDAIRVEGSRNNVQGNVMRGSYWAHGWNVVGAGSADTLVTNNDLFGLTGADTGTRTVTAPGNRPSTGGVGGAQRTATLTVAASNSSPATKAAADYVCTGTNDHLMIQQAIDAAMTLNRAGIIQLMEGVFFGNGSVTLSEDIWLRGAGVDGSYVSGINIVLLDGNYIQVTDMDLRGNITAAVGEFVVSVWLQRLEVDGYIWFAEGPEWLFITDLVQIGNGHIADGGNWSIDLEGAPTDIFIHDVWLDRGLRIHAPGSFCYDVNLSNVHAEGSWYLGQMLELNAVNCSNQASPLTIFECGVSDFPWSVIGSYFGDVLISNSQWGVFDGNTLQSSVHDALVLDTTNGCQISNNLVLTTGGINEAGSAIRLATSDLNHIHGNTGRSGDGGHSTYFIEIAAGCDNNKAWGNDGFGAWDTTAVHDLGTGTDLTSANR